MLNVLLRRELPIFQPADVAYMQDVYDHIVRVTDNIDTYRDLLSSALDSYLSLQSNHLNQIVKVLTIASIILMAASLVTGFYGMNFSNMPELSWGIGSLWALFLIVLIGGGLGNLLQTQGLVVAGPNPARRRANQGRADPGRFEANTAPTTGSWSDVRPSAPWQRALRNPRSRARSSGKK